ACLRKATFVKVGTLHPDAKGLNVLLKVLEEPHLAVKTAAGSIFEVRCGDETAQVVLSLQEEQLQGIGPDKTVAERHDPGQRCHYRQLLVGSSGPRLCGMALKVALVQLEQSPVEGPEDKAKAAQRAADLLRSAPEADIYVLPELAPVGYNDAVFRNLQLLAEEELCEPGTCRHALAEVAKERRCFICYGVPGKQGESEFNIRQVVLDDTGSIVACYNKCHLADFGDGAESKYFKPGERLCYFDCRGFRIGLLICADMRFSELCRELAVGRGCEILLQPAAFARDVSYASWQSFVECRALENQVYWAGVNYAGSYFGGSMWCPPWVDGSDKVVSRMGIEEQITVHEATKEELASTRESFRFLRQRKDRAAYGPGSSKRLCPHGAGLHAPGGGQVGQAGPGSGREDRRGWEEEPLRDPAFALGAAPPVLPTARLTSAPPRSVHETSERGCSGAVAAAAALVATGVAVKRRPAEARAAAVAMRVEATALTRKVGSAVVSLGLLKVLASRIHAWFETPKRPYGDGSVGSAYDDWTREGVLEHYWGEHIHMGSYTPMEKQSGYRKKDPFFLALFRATFGRLKDFKEAKIDFTNEMIDWSRAKAPKKILDVGCGIGGSSRILGKRFPDAEVLGITLSPQQAERAGKLAKEQGLTNVRFQVMDALNMEFEDNTFDMVWACESGEHMPDKKRYVEEMSRVLAPKGNMVVATWCERDPVPMFTAEERKTLNFLYAEWTHPYFISLNKYKEYMEGTELLDQVDTADWTEQTLPAWRHSVWVGVWSPWYWLKVTFRKGPGAFVGFLREVYTLEKFHKSMVSGLMVYGMMRAVKK
ncbi:unnamed protein product, partial [Symbiodinium microadriaticum]